MRPPPAMMPPPRMGAATPPGPAVMAPPTAQMSQMRVGAGGPPPIASTPAAGMTPLVPQPGAPVVGPTGVAVSNFNQMVPPGGPPRPTGPTAPPRARRRAPDSAGHRPGSADDEAAPR